MNKRHPTDEARLKELAEYVAAMCLRPDLAHLQIGVQVEATICQMQAAAETTL